MVLGSLLEKQHNILLCKELMPRPSLISKLRVVVTQADGFFGLLLWALSLSAVQGASRCQGLWHLVGMNPQAQSRNSICLGHLALALLQVHLASRYGPDWQRTEIWS